MSRELTRNSALVGHQCRLTLDEHARNELQARIDGHYQDIIRLKRCINALLSVSRLPNEVLLEIFFRYKAGVVNAKDRQKTFHGKLHWVRIAHVCHHWRDVTLQAPQLWTDLVVTDEESTTVLMARSKRMPLTVEAAMYDPRRVGSVKAIFREIGRIESLDLLLSRQIYDQLHDAAPTTAPTLRSLTLRTDGNTSSSIPMPTLFNACELPALRELTTSGYQINWSAKLLAPTLTRLQVTCWGHYAALCLEILDALRHMPMLEHMDLSGCVLPAPTPEAPPDNAETITLSRLSYMSLTSSSTTLTHLLDRITIPTTCKVAIFLRMAYSISGAPLTPLAHSVLSKISGETTIGTTQPFRSFMIGKELPTTVVLGFWTELKPVKELQCDTSPNIKVSVRLYPPNPEDVLDLCRVVPLGEVESLCIAHVPCSLNPETSWSMLLILLPNVTALRIYGGAAEDLNQILTSSVELPMSERKEYYIPRLRTLLLDGVRFREADDLGNNAFVDEVVDALQGRKDAGYGVEQLVVDSCINMGQRDIRRLREVIHVAWDGVEHYEKIELPMDLGCIGPGEPKVRMVGDVGNMGNGWMSLGGC